VEKAKDPIVGVFHQQSGLGGDQAFALSSLGEVTSLLRERSGMVAATIGQGVILSVWGTDRCLSRRIYKDAASARAAGERTLDRPESGAVAYTVGNRITRTEVLAGAAPLPQEAVRRKPAMKRAKDYLHGNSGWMRQNCGDRNVRTSAPFPRSLGWE
jgi:hypothetical protein